MDKMDKLAKPENVEPLDEMELKETPVKLVNLAEMVLLDLPEPMDDLVLEENLAELEKTDNEVLLVLPDLPEAVEPLVPLVPKELLPTEKMVPPEAEDKLEPLDDPVLKEPLVPLDVVENLEPPVNKEHVVLLVPLEPLVMELPEPKEKVDAPVSPDVKEKLVNLADLVPLD